MSSSVDDRPWRSAAGHADDPDTGHQERCGQIGDQVGALARPRER